MKLFCETSSIFWIWQHHKHSNSARLPQCSKWQEQKRSNSARLPNFLTVTTKKTNQFCVTSFKNGRWVQSCLLYCVCHAKCIFPDPLQMSHGCHRFWKCRKTLTFCSLLARCWIPCACHATGHPNVQKWSKHVAFWLRNVLRATTACTFSTSELPKALRDLQFLTLLTWQCASRHNGVHFFNIWTSKSAPRPSVFYTFDLAMCFAPQWRALFQHLNFQECSEPVSFLHFWLGNVLRATTACTFPTSELPKMLLDRQFSTLLTWQCASHHNGVHFFGIWTSKSAPTLKRFVHFDLAMCFAPQRRALFRLSTSKRGLTIV